MFRLLEQGCALGCLSVMAVCVLGLMAALLVSFQPAPGFSAWPLIVVLLLSGTTAIWLLSRPR